MEFLRNVWEHPRTSAAGLLIAIVTIAGVLSQQGITLGGAGTGTVVSLVGATCCGLAGVAGERSWRVNWSAGASGVAREAWRVGADCAADAVAVHGWMLRVDGCAEHCGLDAGVAECGGIG